MGSAKETMPLTIQTTEKYLMKYKKEGGKQCGSKQIFFFTEICNKCYGDAIKIITSTNFTGRIILRNTVMPPSLSRVKGGWPAFIREG